MPRATAQEVTEADFYPLPEGPLFTAQLISCVEDPVNFTYKKGPKAGQPGGFMKWKWTFVIVEGEHLGTELTGSSEPKITSAVDADFLPLARPYVEGLLGRPIEIGEEIDTDDLVGLTCQVSVRHLPKRPRKDGDGYWYNVEIAEVFHPPTGVGEESQDQSGTNPQVPGYDEPPF